MKEYELYVPLKYNDGSTIEPKKLTRLRERLLLQFGSLTYFPQRNQGFWTLAGVIFRDEIVIYRVVTDRIPRPGASSGN